MLDMASHTVSYSKLSNESISVTHDPLMIYDIIIEMVNALKNIQAHEIRTSKPLLLHLEADNFTNTTL